MIVSKYLTHPWFCPCTIMTGKINLCRLFPGIHRDFPTVQKDLSAFVASFFLCPLDPIPKVSVHLAFLKRLGVFRRLKSACVRESKKNKKL